MKEQESPQFEVHDRDVLSKARSILTTTESPRMWAQAVIDAVKRNEEWRGERCLNLLAPEAPTSPKVRALLSSEIGTRAAEGHIGRLARHPEDLSILRHGGKERLHNVGNEWLIREVDKRIGWIQSLK